MRKQYMRVKCLLVAMAAVLAGAGSFASQAQDPGRVHCLTLDDNTLAVLVECNGRFGMIDSGEDSDYPSGEDARYPLRPGIHQRPGYEEVVMAYLKRVGVNRDNLDFYIGTHAHSDHIGSADEIIRAFHPKRVYIEPYQDAYISDPNRLWDNQYVYDRLLEAAKEEGAEIISDVAKEPDFVLGDGLEIQIKNAGDGYQTTQTPDANDFSLGVLIKNAFRSVFVAGDINNRYQTEERLAEALGHVDVLVLGHHGCPGSNTDTYLQTLSPEIAVLPGNYKYVFWEEDTLSRILNLGEKGIPVFATAWYADVQPAFVFDMNAARTDNIQKNKCFIACDPKTKRRVLYRDGFPEHPEGWIENDGRRYYFGGAFLSAEPGWLKDLEGNVFYVTPEGYALTDAWKAIDDAWYYFDAQGRRASDTVINGYRLDKSGVWIRNRWRMTQGKWWYRHADGTYTTNGWETIRGKWYHFDKQGYMDTGWKWINGRCYYFYPDGHMAAKEKISSFFVDASGAWVKDTWKKNSAGWWYRHGDGSYTKNGWEDINGQRYHFDKRGYWEKKN